MTNTILLKITKPSGDVLNHEGTNWIPFTVEYECLFSRDLNGIVLANKPSADSQLTDKKLLKGIKGTLFGLNVILQSNSDDKWSILFVDKNTYLSTKSNIAQLHPYVDHSTKYHISVFTPI